MDNEMLIILDESAKISKYATPREKFTIYHKYLRTKYGIANNDESWHANKSKFTPLEHKTLEKYAEEWERVRNLPHKEREQFHRDLDQKRSEENAAAISGDKVKYPRNASHMQKYAIYKAYLRKKYEIPHDDTSWRESLSKITPSEFKTLHRHFDNHQAEEDASHDESKEYLQNIKIKQIASDAAKIASSYRSNEINTNPHIKKVGLFDRFKRIIGRK